MPRHPLFPQTTELGKGFGDYVNMKMFTNPIGTMAKGIKEVGKNPGQGLAMMSGLGRGLMPDAINGAYQSMTTGAKNPYRSDRSFTDIGKTFVPTAKFDAPIPPPSQSMTAQQAEDFRQASLTKPLLNGVS